MAGVIFPSYNASLTPRLSLPKSLIIRRIIHTSNSLHKGKLRKLREKFFEIPEDMNKRPSALEIKKKELPPNTPTLGERHRRDAPGMFHIADPKHGYYKGETGTWRDYVPKEHTLKDVIKIGFQDLKVQIAQWKHEKLTEGDIDSIPQPGGRKSYWSFESDEDLDRWVTTADSDWGEGYSRCEMIRSPSGKATLFVGEVSTRAPQDGRVDQAGYCNMAAIKQRAAFHQLKMLDWFLYTHLTLLVRGDGRTYNLNVHCHGHFDGTWMDLWHYPLYTRGGPYWQRVKIPFSKFYFAHKGSVQDNQMPLPLERITGLSITLADRNDGPFCLEVSDIGCMFDPDLTEHLEERASHAYETYQMPHPSYIY